MWRSSERQVRLTGRSNVHTQWRQTTVNTAVLNGTNSGAAKTETPVMLLEGGAFNDTAIHS